MKRIVGMLIVVGAMVAGCANNPGMSLDTEPYYSTPSNPLTLTLVDTVTHQNLWTYDVPVGKTCVVKFERNSLQSWTESMYGAVPATKMKWALQDPGSFMLFQFNEVELPGNPVLMKVSLRPNPAALAAVSPAKTASGSASPAVAPAPAPAPASVAQPATAPAPVPASAPAAAPSSKVTPGATPMTPVR